MEKNAFFQTWRANGKLLLTGEYAVLDGALALAMPTRFGQELTVKTEPGHPPKLAWKSLEPDGTCWFSADYDLRDFQIIQTDGPETAARLASIFHEIRRQQPNFLSGSDSFSATTQTDFPRNWGLGTSSTLLALLSKWSGADPFLLLKNTFGGSGYDLACAVSDSPILYRLDFGQPVIEPTNFFPAFHNCLFFIWLNQKQDSREGIRRFKNQELPDEMLGHRISQLTRHFQQADSLVLFNHFLVLHENLISKTIGLPRAHDLFFSDFWGQTKSLGAWGGDFILATSDRPEAETRAYFSQKGFDAVFRFDEMCIAR